MKSRVISQSSLPFRTGIKFTFLKEGERTLLRNFIKSVEPDLEPEKATPNDDSEEESSGEDFDLFDEL